MGPMLMCLACLVDAPAFAGILVHALLLIDLATVLERADGNWEAALQCLARPASGIAHLALARATTHAASRARAKESRDAGRAQFVKLRSRPSATG